MTDDEMIGVLVDDIFSAFEKHDAKPLHIAGAFGVAAACLFGGGSIEARDKVIRLISELRVEFADRYQVAHS